MKTETEAIERATRSFDRLLYSLRTEGLIPEVGLHQHVIHELMIRLAGFDTNNRFDVPVVGAGEREGRVISPLVKELHLGLTHGIGRSGNLTEQQPKAVGSSILAEISNKLALDAIRTIGIPETKAAVVVPVATGMALSLCLGSWRLLRPKAKYVVFLRIDQKSCFKSIVTAGFEPIIIDGIRELGTDTLITDITKLEETLRSKRDDILAVMSTTSCFAPRGPDNLMAVGQLCDTYNVGHLVNNAYGLQSPECLRRINEAGKFGLIDAFVQSTDKNFLVPVGGSVIATFSEEWMNVIASFYPGRASAVPSRDLVITLLHLGRKGLAELYEKQQLNFRLLREELDKFAKSIGQRILNVPTNMVSLALTLDGWSAEAQTAFGAELFSRGVTGARAIPNDVRKTVDGYEFANFGSHASRQHGGYLNVACALGMSVEEIHELIARMKSAITKFAENSPGIFKSIFLY